MCYIRFAISKKSEGNQKARGTNKQGEILYQLREYRERENKVRVALPKRIFQKWIMNQSVHSMWIREVIGSLPFQQIKQHFEVSHLYYILDVFSFRVVTDRMSVHFSLQSSKLDFGTENSPFVRTINACGISNRYLIHQQHLSVEKYNICFGRMLSKQLYYLLHSETKTYL